MKVRKYIEISLQHEEEVKKAIEFNKENNYEYYLVDDNTLVDYRNVAYLLRVGYEMLYYHDTPLFKHKKYNFNEEIADEVE